MSAKPQYDQDLRAIGQALEAEGITIFELKREPGKYVVSGTPEKPSSLMDVLRQLKSNGRRTTPRTLSFGPREIVRQQWRGCSRRRNSDVLPDFYNLSNTLRTVGAYLDVRNAELLGLEKRPLTVSLLYHNGDGHPRVEDRTIASFYDFFVDQYARRVRQVGAEKRGN